ncbi:MAG TPA: hypothetical protein VF885_05805 [Arthrobacter sp.]
MSSYVQNRIQTGKAAGQYTFTEHQEAAVSLGGSGLTVEDVLQRVAEHNGPGAVPAVEREIAATTPGGGRDLYLQRTDALYNRDSPYRLDRGNYGRPTGAQCEALAALGYTNVNQFGPEMLRNFPGHDTLITNGVEPERLELLAQLPRPSYQWSDWEKEAYYEAPVTLLDEDILDPGRDPRRIYERTVTLLHPERGRRVKEAAELRIIDKALIESVQHPLPVLADLRDALPSSKRGAWHITGLADKGITGRHLKEYGVRAAERFTGKELDESGVEPSAVRSVLSNAPDASLEDIAKFAGGGFVKGRDLRSTARALGTSDADILIEARKHATGEQLATYRQGRREPLTLEDAKAVGDLFKAGIDDPRILDRYAMEVHAEANPWDRRNPSVFRTYADIVTAGITPKKLGRMTRAGIPMWEAAKFKDSTDLWADGSHYRNEYKADQDALIGTPYAYQRRDWAFTAENYTEGTK